MQRGNHLVRAVGAAMIMFLILPTLIIVPMSFDASRFLAFPPPSWSLRWYVELLSDDQWLRAATRSLCVASIVAVLSSLLGTLAATLTDRLSGRAKGLAYVVFTAPLVLPVIVYAISIYGTFAYMRIIGTNTALVLAHTIIALPFPFMTLLASYAQYDRTLDRAASSSGASPVQNFFLVRLPQVYPAIVAGALFAFLTSFDEIVIAMFIGGAEPTLPKLMFDTMRFGVSPVIAAVATLLMLLTSVMTLCALQKRA